MQSPKPATDALFMQGKLEEALDELLIAEEAFRLCNPAHLPLIDNVGLLSLDIVWSVLDPDRSPCPYLGTSPCQNLLQVLLEFCLTSASVAEVK